MATATPVARAGWRTPRWIMRSGRSGSVARSGRPWPARGRAEGMILLLTNDDGIEAPGLAALVAAAEGLGERRVIAPAGPWSGRSHAVTTHEPFRVVERGEGRYAVEATPADCVRVGLH